MILKSVLLPLPPAAAFALFTGSIDAWWPDTHRHTAGPGSRILLLPSGRFYERSGDGLEVELGRVEAWEPPDRLAFDFYVATGPEHPTRVEVSFVAQADGTLVTVQHTPRPQSAALWGERAPRYARSWEQVLAALLRAGRGSD